ncbi:hypothetical protein GCM10025868_10680 [Angustibacter aerolatus]|uniref:Uncharacterized protein n=1 Tax=Angustibacter aerolatus TaxID=1162965 RepID=A0ABQ6JEG4_9ACTN|nr:hypothetical protein GCM10025868_10680 [Angustibacter aerolatus]
MERAVRRAGVDAGTFAAARGTVDQPGVDMRRRVSAAEHGRRRCGGGLWTTSARSVCAMGRHSHRGPGRPVPWDLIGWTAFACVAGALAVLWVSRSWTVAVLVVLAGALGLGVVTLSTLSTRSTRAGRTGGADRRRG